MQWLLSYRECSNSERKFRGALGKTPLSGDFAPVLKPNSIQQSLKPNYPNFSNRLRPNIVLREQTCCVEIVIVAAPFDDPVYLLTTVQHVSQLIASSDQLLHPRSLVLRGGISQLFDRVLEVLILLASIAGRLAVQYPVRGGTLQLRVHGQQLRLYHVDVTLRRVSVQVLDISFGNRHRGAGCWAGLRVLV